MRYWESKLLIPSKTASIHNNLGDMDEIIQFISSYDDIPELDPQTIAEILGGQAETTENLYELQE